MTQRDGMGREVEGGFRMGNTCTPMVDSCWCTAKPIQYCNVKEINKSKKKRNANGFTVRLSWCSEGCLGLLRSQPLFFLLFQPLCLLSHQFFAQTNTCQHNHEQIWQMDCLGQTGSTGSRIFWATLVGPLVINSRGKQRALCLLLPFYQITPLK